MRIEKVEMDLLFQVLYKKIKLKHKSNKFDVTFVLFKECLNFVYYEKAH